MDTSLTLSSTPAVASTTGTPKTLTIPQNAADQTSVHNPEQNNTSNNPTNNPTDAALLELNTLPAAPPTSTSTPTPKPRKPQLTRDQRRSILLMRSLGYTYLRIAQQLHITVRGVQYTCEQRSASPKPRPGRSRILTEAKMAEIETFVTESIANRQLNYAQLIERLGLDVKEDTLVQSLRRRGYARQMAFLRSPLAPRGGNRTAKPVRTWLTCRKDERIECPSVLEIVRVRGRGEGKLQKG